MIYFKDIEKCANELADNHFGLSERSEKPVDDELLVWPVREHYLVYLPVKKGLIIIVSLIRQSRDVPAIIASNSFIFRREIKSIRKSIDKLRM